MGVRLRFQIAVAALVFFLFATGSGRQPERIEAVPALMQTEYSTYYSTLTSTYVSHSIRYTTETQYGTIYLTAYHRQLRADGPDVNVKCQGRVALSGYTADVSATVVNLLDDVIFNVAVTLQVVRVYADGTRSKLGTGVKLKFKESILPRESITASDTLRIEYNPAYGDGYGTGPVPPPYLPNYNFALDFWGVDFSTYPFKTATATMLGYSTVTETLVATRTLTYVSEIVLSSTGISTFDGWSSSGIFVLPIIAGMALIILFLLRRRKLRSRVSKETTKYCPECGLSLSLETRECPRCKTRQYYYGAHAEQNQTVS